MLRLTHMLWLLTATVLPRLVVPLALPPSAPNATQDHLPSALVPTFACDVDLTSHSSKALNLTLQRLHHRNHTKLSRAQRRQQGISTNLYVHVISSAVSAGTVTQDTVNSQVKALNAVFSRYGITFNLTATTFTVNDAWAQAADSDMPALKSALRSGSYSDLNLYFHTDFTASNLGTCTLPAPLPQTATKATYAVDGCNVHAGTMPGGALTGFNLGMTAVHETGHWLGLLHTFQGNSCDGDGDFIADTRTESTSTSGCPSTPAKNSCPQYSGVDPIHNYMDYSFDSCYTEFTPGQLERISTLWQEYRQGR